MKKNMHKQLRIKRYGHIIKLIELRWIVNLCTKIPYAADDKLIYIFYAAGKDLIATDILSRVPVSISSIQDEEHYHEVEAYVSLVY